MAENNKMEIRRRHMAKSKNLDKSINKGFWCAWASTCKEASYTVEATLVMGITLFLIGALLTGAFDIHSEVVGDLILQEAMEQTGHMETLHRAGERAGLTAGEILENANRDLKEYFWCGNVTIDINETLQRLNGNVEGKQDNSISVKKFDPEKFLRLLRAVGI